MMEITISRIIVGVVMFGCAYAVRAYFKKHDRGRNKDLLNQNQPLKEILDDIEALQAEMLKIRSSNPSKFDDVLNKQLNKYAWHSLSMEDEPTDDKSIEMIAKVSKYAETHLRLGQVTDSHIRTIHGKLTEEKYFAGRYRAVNVKITCLPDSNYGDFFPPDCDQVNELMSEFIRWLNQQRCTKPADMIKIATEAKVRFLVIHPFVDGNGRASRAIFNGLLRQMQFPWVEMPAENKYQYLLALEKYCNEKKMILIRRFVACCVREALENVITDMKKST